LASHWDGVLHGRSALPVAFEPRGEACTRCAAAVSMKIIRHADGRRTATAIHDDDGTPADELCGRDTDVDPPGSSGLSELDLSG
jgi:hypothetical protein